MVQGWAQVWTQGWTQRCGRGMGAGVEQITCSSTSSKGAPVATLPLRREAMDLDPGRIQFGSEESVALSTCTHTPRAPRPSHTKFKCPPIPTEHLLAVAVVVLSLPTRIRKPPHTPSHSACTCRLSPTPPARSDSRKTNVEDPAGEGVGGNILMEGAGGRRKAGDRGRGGGWGGSVVLSSITHMCDLYALLV